MRIPIKEWLMKWKTDNIKRCTYMLLVLLIAAAYVIDLPNMVFADGISGNKWVSYRVRQDYDKDNKRLTITVDAVEENADVTIERMILPDGTTVNGSQATYTVGDNGNYKFSVEYTVRSATASSSTASSSTASPSETVRKRRRRDISSMGSPSEAAGKRKKRDIDVGVTAFATGDVTINDVTNFPDPLFRKWLSENSDKNRDGVLDRNERLSVVKMQIIITSSQDLRDMTGLQFFPNIETLTLINHSTRNLELKLDVSRNLGLKFLTIQGGMVWNLDLSKNRKLTTVTVEGVKGLTTLDFSQNPDLDAMILTGNYDLVSMNISQNQKFRELLLYDSPLTNLDFSQNPIFSELTLRRVPLSSLNVSQNPELIYMELESIPALSSLDISNNINIKNLYLRKIKFPGLDLSQNVNLLGLIMDEVECDNTIVDISQNPLLRRVVMKRETTGNTPNSVDLSQHRELEEVQLKNIPINSVDVSNSPSLKALTVMGTTLNGIDVSKNPKLEILFVPGTGLNSVDVSKNPLLMSTDLSANQLTSLDVSNNPNLEVLYINKNKLDTIDLSRNTKLTAAKTRLEEQTIGGVYYKPNWYTFEVDFKYILDPKYFNNIVNVYQGRRRYPFDPATGIINPSRSPVSDMYYQYNTGNPVVPIMRVDLRLKSGFLIVSTAGPGGSITPLGNMYVGSLTDYVYRITPDPGNEVDVLTVNGTVVPSALEYTFVNVVSAGTISVTFRPATEYRINATAGAGGSINPPGETVVAAGADQEYTITPAPGFELDELSVDGTVTANADRYTFRDVRADHRINATFRAAPPPAVEYRITAAAGVGGSITPPGTTMVREGADQTYRITSEPGYELNTLSVDGAVIANAAEYTFLNVRANHSIEAAFRLIPPPPVEYRITSVAGVGGSITPPGVTVVVEGSNQEYMITPAAGYELDTLSVDGTAIGNVARYTFLDVRADHSIEAAFRLIPPLPVEYRITSTAGAGGNINPLGDTVVPAGGSQEYIITPDVGFELDVLSVDGTPIGNTTRYSFLDVRADRSIDATFKRIPPPAVTYKITAAAGAGGSINPPGETVVAAGGSQEYSITPDVGFELDVLSVDGTPIVNTARYIFLNVSADHRIDATFKVIPPPAAAYKITAVAGAGGSIIPPGETVVAAGGFQEYRITPDKGYELDTLSVDGVKIGKTDQYAFRDVRADHSIEATFKVIPPPPAAYKITATAGAGGSITPPGETVVAAGAAQEYRITPDKGYELDLLSVDGVKISNTDRYVFLDVRANHRIGATFKVITPPAAAYRITAAAGAGGSITPPGETVVPEGGTQEYRITPDAGYELAVLLVDGIKVAKTDYYAFRDVRENHRIEGTFKLNKAPVTSGGHGGGGVTSGRPMDKPTTSVKFNLNSLMKPISMAWAAVWPNKKLVQMVPEEVLPEPAPREELPTQEVVREVRTTEATEELTPVEPIENPLKNPEVALENQALGRRTRSHHHHPPLVISFLLISGAGVMIIKKERDMMLQM